MFLRLVYESFRRQTRRKLLAGVAIMLGVAVATAMIALATDIGDKINRELRSYGANLVVTPQQDSLDLEMAGTTLRAPGDGPFLNEDDLPRIKEIFWAHNITGIAPMLSVNTLIVSEAGAKDVTLVGTYFARPLAKAESDFLAGVRRTNPWWKVTGTWPKDNSGDVLVGQNLARQLRVGSSDTIRIGGQAHRVSGVVASGGEEENQVVAPLSLAQQILGRPHSVRRIYVSALTKPEDALARRDPKTMSPAMFERWSCSPYAQSIAFQLQRAIPHSHAEQIRQVAQNEGVVLTRIEGLMLLVTMAALLASALAVSAAMATAIMERRVEVGLMKALGGGKKSIAALFFSEATLLALLGGVAGYLSGTVLADQIGQRIFNSQITMQPILLPIILGIAVLVTFAGSAVAIRKAVLLDPVFALRGES